MAVAETLLVNLGTRLAKFLLKTYLNEPGEALGVELVDIAKGKIKDVFDRRAAQRQFEDIGERIAKQLLPVFEVETRPGEVTVEAVIDQLGRTLEGNISAEFFVARDLDPAKLLAEMRRVRPLPTGQFSAGEVQLYERSLAEAVRYIVEVAAKLPRFEVTKVKASLQRLTRIEDVVGETAEDVRRIKQWVDFQESDTESRQYELDYRLAVARNLDYLELFGADLSPESRRQALSVAYVSLTLETSVDRHGEAEPAPVETVLDGFAEKNLRLLIRGEAGSGKSTLFRWAAIQAAKEMSADRLVMMLNALDPDLRAVLNIDFRTRLSRLEANKILKISESTHRTLLVTGITRLHDQLRLSWRLKLPFLLRLRDCRGGKLPPPDDFPELIAKEVGSPPTAWVREVLKAGRGLLLFDGIDEIPDLYRETIRRELEAIIRAFPDNFFLVSTRPEAVPADWLGSLEFNEAHVNPMSDLDRSRFIDKWHEAVATELGRRGKPTNELTRLADELKRQLPENPSVARLATNPLLCAMICALHRDRGQKLPESQSDLCESLCQVLLHRRERESDLDLSEFPESYRNLKYQQKRLIVQEIAHSMVLNGESSITVERGRQKVADALHSLAGQSEEDAAIVCRALVERSGMLRETKPGYLDFIHNTFKEYLAGDRFANSGDAGLLAEHALDTTWQRVIQFAVSTSRQGFADDVIRRLLDAPAATGPAGSQDRLRKTKSRVRQLLALQCRATALLVDPELEASLDRIARTMFPPKTMGDAEALAASGEMGIPFLVYRKGLKARQAAACVRSLRLIGTPRAQAVLEGYFDERREVVVSELCQAVNPLSLRAIQEKLTAGKALSEGIRSQISDLSPLAGLSSLQALDLRGTPVSNVSALSGLSSLQVLDLRGTRVSDVSALSGLRSLHNLDLEGTRVSDVSALSGLSSLQVLDLRGTPVSDVSALSGLSSLQVLNLIGTAVLDISALSGLSGLQRIDLGGTAVSDVSPLSDLRSLEWLDLRGTPVSDVSALSGLSSLQVLDLRETPVSDVSALSGLSSLQRLVLNDTAVSDVSALSGLSNLKHLDLSGTRVSDVSVLSRLNRLQELFLIGTAVSDIAALSGLSSLQRLVLNDTAVSDVSALSCLSGLQELFLTGTVVSDVSSLQNLPSLRIIQEARLVPL